MLDRTRLDFKTHVICHFCIYNVTLGVNFINVFTYKFFVRTLFQQLFLVTFWLWQKIRMKNVREKRWWNWPKEGAHNLVIEVDSVEPDLLEFIVLISALERLPFELVQAQKSIDADSFFSLSDKSSYQLQQACQTGHPRAACGPIAYLMRPAVAYLNQTVTQNCN